MIFLRSLAFHSGFYLWTGFLCLISLPTLLISRRWVLLAAQSWSRGSLALLRWIGGCHYQIKGWEHLPEEPVIIACKHQSAWETVVFHMVFNDPVYVLKNTLLRLPIYGWYVRRLGMIALDRQAGSLAMRNLIRQGKRALKEEKRHVIIFPEGTRSRPGQSIPYQAGVAALYNMLKTPVVPVALNSGLFWPRRGFFIQPGLVTLELLSPIASGLERRAFMQLLAERIETASENLCNKPPGLCG